MKIVYDIALRVYYLLVLIVSFFSEKAIKWIEGRKNLFEQIKLNIKENENIVWFHSASLGEFEQGRPVIEALKKKRTDIKILVTFFSPSGYEARKNYPYADYIFYLPLDFYGNAKNFIDIVKPSAVYFIKYEFWYNYVHILHSKNIPVYCISANFRANQVFFKWYGNWFRKILTFFTHIYVQNKKSEELLKNIGINNVSISGDTRFDRVFQISHAARQIPIIEQFVNYQMTMVAGSTWPQDDELLVRHINETNIKCKYIIVPHEIHPDHIEKLVHDLKKKTIRYSQAEGKELSSYSTLIIDNIGILSSVYQYGKIAYIGGGFGKGIHNILEAATFGLPILFGPNYQKFQEALDLVEAGGSFSINNYADLTKFIHLFLSDSLQLEKASAICRNYVKNNIGATEIILKNSKI
jgi:3-deoxy-D-manno-octulosonic-acid transferase